MQQLQFLKTQTDTCDSYIIKSQLFWKIIILSLAQVIWIGHIPVYPIILEFLVAC